MRSHRWFRPSEIPPNRRVCPCCGSKVHRTGKTKFYCQSCDRVFYCCQIIRGSLAAGIKKGDKHGGA